MAIAAVAWCPILVQVLVVQTSSDEAWADLVDVSHPQAPLLQVAQMIPNQAIAVN